MKKLMVVMCITAASLLPLGVAQAHGTQADSQQADSTGVALGGDYGTSRCYVALDYFEIGATVSPVYPFVHVTTMGSVGGEVHCPLGPTLDDLFN